MLRRPILVAYLIALICVSVALLLTMLCMPLLQIISFSFFFAAVTVSAWYGGLGPGLFATALSTLASDYFLLPPLHSLGSLAPDDAVRVGLFALAAILISVLMEMRKRSAEAIRQQREWLRVVLASISEGVIATDTNGHVSFLNPVARTLTGWSQEEVQGKPLSNFFKIIDERTREPEPSPVTRVIVVGNVVKPANPILLVSKNGSETQINGSASPIRNDRGKLIGVVLIFHKVGENQIAETSSPAPAI